MTDFSYQYDDYKLTINIYVCNICFVSNRCLINHIFTYIFTLQVEDFEATTYKEHEIKLLKESVQSVAMSVGIALVMSFKFNIHMSLLVQSIMLPLGLFDNLVLKKYISGLFLKQLTPEEQLHPNDRLYKELDSAPTQAIVNAINAANKAATETEVSSSDTPAVAASSSSPSSSSASSSSSGGNNKTTVEVPDAKKGSKTTPASDLD